MKKYLIWVVASMLFIIAFLAVLAQVYIHTDTLTNAIYVVVPVTDASLVSLLGVDVLKHKIRKCEK